MPELDTLRGIAVLSVVFFHAFGFEYGVKGLTGIPKYLVAATLPGWVGVNLFFVLSGFLITGILIDTRSREDYYRRFYLRRALRILPIYYGVLLLLAIFSRAGIIARPASWAFLGLSFIYLANVTNLFGVTMQYGVLWSLAVEEHFYLLWPTVARFFSRRGLTLVAALIFVGCPVLRAFYFLRGYDSGDGYTWLCADGLALGALLAIAARGWFRARVQFVRLAMGTLLISLVTFAVGAPFGIFRASRILGFTLRDTGLNLFFFGLISTTLVLGTSRWKWAVNHRSLQFLGEISYGVYLIHMLVFDVVDRAYSLVAPGLVATPGKFSLIALRFCVGGMATIAVAYLSRWYFEEPFLRLKDGLGQRSPATEPASLTALAGDDGSPPEALKVS
jgi:peptidoglycan/LPS O-acetylase OafA/YrhL